MAITARALFETADEKVQPGTQGNSAGALNSPKVITEGNYQCGECESACKSKADISVHMRNHDRASYAETITKNITNNDKEFKVKFTEIFDDIEDEAVTIQAEEIVSAKKN